MTEQPKNRISSGVAATLATAAIAVAGVVAYFNFNTPTIDPDTSILNSSGQTNPPERSTDTDEKTATVYWLEQSADGTSFKLVPQGIQVEADRKKPSEFLKAAFNQLLAGPTEGSASSTIPQGTKLLSIKVEGDEDEVVRVNLSEDFQFGGGSASMIGRLGQIVYTATALNEKAQVYLELNGEQIDVLGGEGLELQQPLTRDNYDKNFEL